MAATPAKRGFCAADVYSNLDFNAFDFHTIPFLSYHDTQKLDLSTFSTFSTPYKRARLSQLDQLADQWSSSRATRPDIQHKFGVTASTSFPCPSLTSHPGYLIHVEANEDGCDNKQTACLLSNAGVSSAGGDMPAKRRALPSNAGKHKSVNKSDLEFSPSTKLSSSTSEKNSHGVSSRRRPVRGENIPRLATTWRETTSSRGADNTFRVRNQVNANDDTSSTSNISFSDVATDGLESNIDYHIAFGDWTSTFEPDAIHEQQSLYSASQLPHSEESPQNTNMLLPYMISSSTGGDLDFTPISIHQYQDTGSENANNYIPWSASSDNFWMEPILSNTPTSMPAPPSVPFESYISSSIRPDYVSLSEDKWASHSIPPLLEDIDWNNNIQETNTNTTSLWFPELAPETAQTEAYIQESSFPFMTASFPPGSIDSSRFSTRDFLSPPIEGLLESSTDLQSNDGISDSIELQEVMSSKSESEGNEPSDRHIINDYLSLRKRPPSDISAESRPWTGSRFNAKISHLNNGVNDNSSVLVVAEDTNDTQPEVQKFLAQANQQSRPSKAGSSRNSPSRKVATTWEHTFVVQKKFTEAASEPAQERTSQSLGRRRRPLSEDIRERAKEMRKIRSCRRCKVSKIACTPGEICEPCSKVQPSMFSGRICIRAHLIDYLKLFLPEQAVRPFQQASIDQLMAKKISGFSNNQFNVYLSSGPSYPPILVTVHTFRAKDRSFLFLKEIKTDNASKESTFVESYSPPLGITDFSQDLRGKLTKHIQSIVEGERDFGEVLYGNTSQLAWDVHEAVRSYQRTNPMNPLLQKVLMLYAMQFFMTKTIVMLRDTSEQVLENIATPMELNTQNPNLRLINIQIKHVMQSLITKTYLEVLTDLEKDLRPKELALWAPTFCCILILCLCAEMVQTTSDFRIVNALDDIAKSTDGLDKNGNSASRDDSIDICLKLDDLPIASIESSFHLIYKTTKYKDGPKREQGFNPIRDGPAIVRKVKLGKNVEDFVERIIAIVAEHRNELNHEATVPSFNRSSNVVEDHRIFQTHNSGRVVSRFIQSML